MAHWHENERRYLVSWAILMILTIVGEVENYFVIWFGEEQHKRVEKEYRNHSSVQPTLCSKYTRTYREHGMHLVCSVFQPYY